MQVSKLTTTLLLSVLCMLMAACSNSDDTSAGASQQVATLRVAVFVPADRLTRWQTTAQWACDNMKQAQQQLAQRVDLQLTFYDENAANAKDMMNQVAQDPNVDAVVGPCKSENAELMAYALANQQKPMISPSATNVEYQRQFADSAYVWNMAENDVTQLEVMISECASNLLAPLLKIYLLAPDIDDDQSRNAYSEWFGFLAEEYGLDVGEVMLYADEDELRNFVRSFYDKSSSPIVFNALLFAPKNSDEAYIFDNELQKLKTELEQNGSTFSGMPVFCSDAFVGSRMTQQTAVISYEGLSLYARPESGFHIAYEEMFGQTFANGEAQFYDALCLLSYAKTLSASTQKSLIDALFAVCNGKDGSGGGWMPTDMAVNYRQLAQGKTPDIDGVSSLWNLASPNRSTLTGSTYSHWMLSDRKFVPLEYISTKGSNRTSSSKSVWDWTATQTQKFIDDTSQTTPYPPLKERWALLVAGSRGWANYRFQADVFAMYQLLRQHGYDDDHIVLIAEGDVATHSKNTFAPDLRTSNDGPNLYQASAIDYKLSQLTAADLSAILSGKRSDHLPHVLGSTDNDNVFIFWSSHGDSDGSLFFGDKQRIDYQTMRNMLQDVAHRKMLCVVEACYSGGLGETCQRQLDGTLLITAANPYETSHASGMSTMGVYLTNSFTQGFIKAVTNNSHISLRDLYYSLAANTSGSHVKLYNSQLYGSVYLETMADYLP